MRAIALALVVLAGCARSAPTAGPGPTEVPALPASDRIEDRLVAPDRVLARAEVIGLSDEEAARIADDLTRTKARWDELATRLESERAALIAVLDQPRIDEDAARRAAQAIVVTEGQLKVAHLELLVRTRNALTPEQRAALRQP